VCIRPASQRILGATSSNLQFRWEKGPGLRFVRQFECRANNPHYRGSTTGKRRTYYQAHSVDQQVCEHTPTARCGTRNSSQKCPPPPLEWRSKWMRRSASCPAPPPTPEGRTGKSKCPVQTCRTQIPPDNRGSVGVDSIGHKNTQRFNKAAWSCAFDSGTQEQRSYWPPKVCQNGRPGDRHRQGSDSRTRWQASISQVTHRALQNR